MRAAPPVSVRCQPGWGWFSLHAALAALAFAAVTTALWQQLPWPPGLAGVVLACAGLSGAAAGWWAAPRHAGELRWDGQAWWFQPRGAGAAHTGRLHVMIDLGDWMLLCFDCESVSVLRRRRWLPLGALPAAQACALRAALYWPRLNSPENSARRLRSPE